MLVARVGTGVPISRGSIPGLVLQEVIGYSGDIFTSARPRLTPLTRPFLELANPIHRQYEALRAYFLEGLPSHEVAARFGYTPGSFRVLCHAFRQDPTRAFFLASRQGPRPTPFRDRLRETIVALRKRNLSIYDISRTLAAEGTPRSPVAVSLILKEEGFAKLPRRHDDERPAGPRTTVAAVADVRALDLSPRQIRTQFGGLFLFVPLLAQIPLETILRTAGFPGSQMIPAAPAMRALLGLKLYSSRRHSHVMADVLDEGLALFAGLNVMPKRSFLTEYSCRIHPHRYPRLMQGWCEAMTGLGLPRGVSFDLDFHTIPFSRGRRAGPKTLRLEAVAPTKRDPRLSRAGRRHARLLLRERPAPQRHADRRGPALRGVLEGAHGPRPGGAHF